MKETVIAVRHGAYDSNFYLSYSGTEQMRRVSELVALRNPDGLPVILLCSTDSKAKQGGAIIAETLSIVRTQIVYDECLWDDSHHPGDRDKARALLDAHCVAGVVVVCISHLDTVLALAYHMARKHGHACSLLSPRYGEGWLIDKNGIVAFP